MKLVALLPMKARSERVKGKNFRPFCGKPLYRWMLDTLLAVPTIEKVVINTDARHLLTESGLVESDRVVIRDRPEAICGDLVSMNRVIRNDVENIDSEHFLMTHTTNPLLSKSSVEKAIEYYYSAIERGEADSLFSVNKVQARFYDKLANPINHHPESLIRTQDLEPWYEENSSLYLFSRNSFSNTGARIGSKPTMLETPSLESVDIDTPDDWELAEIIVQLHRQKGVIW